MVLKDTLDDQRAPFACDGAIVYRLHSPAADHCYIINDAPARPVVLDTVTFRYCPVKDAITEESLSLDEPIYLHPYEARWLRCEKEFVRSIF